MPSGYIDKMLINLIFESNLFQSKSCKKYRFRDLMNEQGAFFLDKQKMLRKRNCKQPSQYLLAQSQTGVALVSLLLTLNRLNTLFWCFQCWLWISKYRLGTVDTLFWIAEYELTHFNIVLYFIQEQVIWFVLKVKCLSSITLKHCNTELKLVRTCSF